MTDSEHWKQQLTSNLRGRPRSDTEPTAQTATHLEDASWIQHSLSKLKLPKLLPLPSKPASDIGRQSKTPPIHQVASDSGTELRYFDRPISEQLKARFFDIKFLYTETLLDYISRRKKDPGDISMKLKHLGLNTQSIRLYIVIQCEKRVVKQVRKFFAQRDVEEELAPDFQVLVLAGTLVRLASDDAIEVLSASLPEKTMCGMPIILSRGGKSVTCTIGGVIMVRMDSQDHFYGLIAGHPLKTLQRTLSCDQPTTEAKVSLSPSSSSGDESSESDEDFTDTSEPSSKAGHSSMERNDDNLGRTRLSIGTVFFDNPKDREESNYDWALVELDREYALPNLMIEQPQSGSNFQDREVEIHNDHPGPCDATPTKRVVVLKRGRLLMAELTLNTTSVMIAPGSKLVDAHDITMEDDSSLQPGDSGLWVVDATTAKLYGHLISVDAFGEGQVIAIHSTLESIRRQLKARWIFLPSSQELDKLQATLKKQPPSNIRRPHGLDVEPTEESLGLFPLFDRPDIVGSINTVDAFAYNLYFTSLYHESRHSDTILPIVCTELRDVHRSLVHLRTEILDRESILHDPPVVVEIHDLLEMCYSILARWRAILSSYGGSGMPSGSDTESPMVSHREPQIESVRMRIAASRTRIESFLDTVQLGETYSIGRGQPDMEGIKDKVDKITNRLFEEQNAPSYWGDRDDLWERCQAHLQKEGLSPAVLHKNRGIIRAYVRERANAASAPVIPFPTVRTLLEPPGVEGADKLQDSNYIQNRGDDSNESRAWFEVVSTQSLIALDATERLMVNQKPLTIDGTTDDTTDLIRDLHWIARCYQYFDHMPTSHFEHPHRINFWRYGDFEWTKIASEHITIDFLQRAGFHCQARPGYVAVVGRLSGEEVRNLIHESQTARRDQIDRDKANDRFEDQEAEVSYEVASTHFYDDSTEIHPITVADRPRRYNKILFDPIYKMSGSGSNRKTLRNKRKVDKDARLKGSVKARRKHYIRPRRGWRKTRVTFKRSRPKLKIKRKGSVWTRRALGIRGNSRRWMNLLLWDTHRRIA